MKPPLPVVNYRFGDVTERILREVFVDIDYEAQVLTYLRLMKREVGLLLNFNEPTLKAGIRRMILGDRSDEPRSNPQTS